MADAGYNPYSFRVVEKPLTNLDAFVSLLKCIIGTGILAMPLAFKFGGLIGGAILTTICVVLLIYGIHILILCMVECSRRTEVPYATYPETMVFACNEGPSCCRHFAKPAGVFVDIILSFCHYGCCVVYVVFVAVNLKQFFDEYVTQVDLRVMAGIVGIACLPLFLLRHMKYLVPGNIVATVLMLFGLFAIFWYVFQGLPEISKRQMLPSVLHIPFLLGIVMFATSSVGVMVAIESKMAKPAEYLGWFGVLNCASIFIVVLNVAFGFFGYWRYGDNSEASITLNIPNDEVLAQVIKLFIAIAIFFTYPLSGYVVVDIIMNHYILKKERKHPIMLEYIVRVIFVIVATVNAIAFPNLGPLVALVGAFSISLLNLVFPCIIDLCLYYKYSYGYLKWKMWKDILMIIVGFFVLIIGTYISIRDMIEEYTDGGKKDTTAEDGTTTTTTTVAPAAP